jgi:hypothetical protein
MLVMTMYLIYTDDSGDEEISLHLGLMVPVESWRDCLIAWKKYRLNALAKKHNVPAEVEIHAQEWLTGSNNIVSNPRVRDGGRTINDTKGMRQEALHNAMKTFTVISGIEVFADVVNTPQKQQAYRHYIQQLDAHLDAHGDLGLVVMDGDPKNPDPVTRDAHRALNLGPKAGPGRCWKTDGCRTPPAATSSKWQT